jgi:heme/copper-type cytochrome/quinol oxidase subunit 2
VGVGNLTFYDPGWLWVDALVLISVAILPLLAIALAYYAVKRWRPKYAKRTLLAARIAWTTTGVAIVIILFIVDILRRPDWVPFITHVS